MVNRMYISECGNYVAFSLGHANFDVLQSNGDYWPDPPLSEYPLRRQVGGYSNLKTKKKYRFSLDLLVCDTQKKIKPGEGNTIISSKEIFFSKEISLSRLPKWAKALLAYDAKAKELGRTQQSRNFD